ncbi:MAG: mechanosensitive ion channel [Deltaproteobacteria bacterium]|nr:mechanosensitive ion channel [Deltaproteobacteria bacterium]
MNLRIKPSRIILFLILIILVAIPLILDALLETRFSRYISWLESGITVGGAKITIINIFYLIIFFVFITFTSRILRETLQKRVLPRTHLETGARASIVNIVIYSFWIFAVFIGINLLGINLSSLTFIGGALGIGIGFGLQNIVNNFISGIILLFDTSIQVGDMVQLGTDRGTVTRINIRTTIVQTFDNASMIIPNSEMLSNMVTNWSFKDPKVRLQVNVGVAYGSDVRLVRKTLEGILEDIPEILNEPAPRVDFTDFGDSALIFTIRFWIPSPDFWLSIPTELRFRIDEEFRKNNIEIAFPQRDIHIRSVSGLEKILKEEELRK